MKTILPLSQKEQKHPDPLQNGNNRCCCRFFPIATLLIVSLVAVFLLTACAVVPAGRGHGSGGVTIVPILPHIVVLDVEPYYFHSGFHYHYKKERWYYSRSRSGPWIDLPRDHYPKEVRYKKRDRKHDRDRDDDDRDRDRDRDDRRR